MSVNSYHNWPLPELLGSVWKQGWIKGGGATEAIAPGPRLQGDPRDEIYLFQIKFSFEKFSWLKSGTWIQLYIIFLCCVKGPNSNSFLCKFDCLPALVIATEKVVDSTTLPDIEQLVAKKQGHPSQ